MRKIVVSIQNGLLAEAITTMLSGSDEFQPFRIAAGRKGDSVVSSCEMFEAELLLSEVSYASGTTVDTRLREAEEMRKHLPNCQIVFLCDENSSPEIARTVTLAKKDGLIDAFFYSSVTSKYLLAALSAL